jgi:hypothetical protein
MRQGQQNNKRMRGRNRKGPNPLSRSYESNGPDVKVRGTALHIAEKYVQLARDAQSAGDRVQAENYLQHAEHYYRIVSAAQAQMPQPQQVYRSDVDGDDEEERSQVGGQPYPQFRSDQTAFGGADPQPYVNGNGQDRGDDEQPVTIDEPEDAQEPQPQADLSLQPDVGEPPREGRREGFRPRRRRPYRERGERSGNSEAASAPQPEGAGAGGDE